jgi:pimeloyl-ACP methyl ester carboxylesterase
MDPIVSQMTMGESRLRYYRWGHGPKIIVALHGFGERGSSFAGWGALLPEGFTLYAPDLPFHGDSTWSENEPFTVHHLRDLIDHMTEGAVSFILCGFSMGGRLSLSLCEQYPGLIEKIVLLAPDGLKVNFWYWLSTQTRIGNRLFRSTMDHPGWFIGGVRLLGKYHLVNSGIVKYVERYLQERSNRIALYQIWTCMRTFRPDLKIIGRIIVRQKCPTQLIFGHYDRIIQPSQGHRLQKYAGGFCTIRELPTGHQLLATGPGAICLQIVTG